MEHHCLFERPAKVIGLQLKEISYQALLVRKSKTRQKCVENFQLGDVIQKLFDESRGFMNE